jgi:hypothetical protein
MFNDTNSSKISSLPGHNQTLAWEESSASAVTQGKDHRNLLQTQSIYSILNLSSSPETLRCIQRTGKCVKTGETRFHPFTRFTQHAGAQFGNATRPDSRLRARMKCIRLRTPYAQSTETICRASHNATVASQIEPAFAVQSRVRQFYKKCLLLKFLLGV